MSNTSWSNPVASLRLSRVAPILLCTAVIVGCGSTAANKPKIKNLFGPSGRAAQIQAKDRLTALDSLEPLEGHEDLAAAQVFYDDKKYSEAEKAFKKVAKKYKDKPIEEDALFMLAESQFAQQRYAKAQDSYNKLMSSYESTRYLEKSSERLFTIARQWLGNPEEATQSEIRLATGGEDPAAPPTPLEKQKRSIPLIPNVWDHSRPIFDTDGRALEALKAVWLNHPTGPMADDAVMMSGVYHLRTGNYLEAERFFDMVRKHYPDSPHANDAYIFGSLVLQLSYQGPEYDGQGLEKARELTESMLNLYPDSPDNARLEKSLARIQNEKAHKWWERVRYRIRRGELQAAEVNCATLMMDYPNTKYADMAKTKLSELRAKRLGNPDDASQSTTKPKEDYPVEDSAVGETSVGDDSIEYEPELEEPSLFEEPPQ